MHGTKLALEHLSKDGVVINVASLAGILTLPFAPTYAATKAAVISYTRYMFVCIL
jgi:short-subunit dehydrogenase